MLNKAKFDKIDSVLRFLVKILKIGMLSPSVKYLGCLLGEMLSGQEMALKFFFNPMVGGVGVLGGGSTIK